MGGTKAQLPVGRQVALPGHCYLPSAPEFARRPGKAFDCGVRLHQGCLDETAISEQQAGPLAGTTINAPCP